MANKTKELSEEELIINRLAAAKFKEIRRNKKLSQGEIAQLLNVSENTISNKERNKTPWTFADIMIILKIAEHPIASLREFVQGNRKINISKTDIENVFSPKTNKRDEQSD